MTRVARNGQQDEKQPPGRSKLGTSVPPLSCRVRRDVPEISQYLQPHVFEWALSQGMKVGQKCSALMSGPVQLGCPQLTPAWTNPQVWAARNLSARSAEAKTGQAGPQPPSRSWQNLAARRRECYCGSSLDQRLKSNAQSGGTTAGSASSTQTRLTAPAIGGKYMI